MHYRFLIFALLATSVLLLAQSGARNVETPSVSQSQSHPQPVPEGIIFKGAAPSATDSEIPLPENGSLAGNLYSNRYFHISYTIPSGWFEEFKGPPPSDTGYYVLTQLRPTEAFKDSIQGTILAQAQDLFFTLAPADNTAQLINYMKQTLRPEYSVERPPTEIRIANHPFIRFDYVAPVAGLHFYVLATEIRCHAVEFIFTSRDPKLLETLVQEMAKMKLAAETDAPVCIKNYASGDHVTYKVAPVLKDRRFNPIPVRIIISKEGKIKHIHFISAFPDQAEIIKTALMQWRFKPYLLNGEPSEVETGILFGDSRRTPAQQPGKAIKSSD